MQLLYSIIACTAALNVAFAAPFTSRAATSSRTFAQLQISSGTGGTALTEAQAKFPGNPAALTNAQVAQFNNDAQCAVQAEAAFISAINANKGNKAKVDALNVGMIKNKILKIYGTLQALEGIMVQNIAKGNKFDMNVTIAHLQELEVKLAKNTGTDVTNKGKESATVAFTCPS